MLLETSSFNKKLILDQTSCNLKKLFVGLDDIIDRLIQYIRPWYLDPDLTGKPTIISLWGMTGTGKTSLVKELIKCLNLDDRLVQVDCGTLTKDDLAYELSSSLMDTGHSLYYDNKMDKYIFILDEFQLCKTISEDGSEVDSKDSGNSRIIWELLDSGKLTINSSDWDQKKYDKYIKCLKNLVDDGFGDVELENLKIKNREDYDKIVRNNCGTLLLDEETVNIKALIGGNNLEDLDTEEYLVPPRILYNIREILKAVYKDKGQRTEFYNALLNSKTINELCDTLSKITKNSIATQFIDCSNCLVFVIGNLDEAFYGLYNEMDPDYDADVLNKLTSKVSINDIKSSLLRRFRAEQVGRFGNSIIVYPTLKSSDFRKIIKNKSQDIINNVFNNKIKEEHLDVNIKIELTESALNLLYAESVYPSLGVRPLESTLKSILVPFVSNFLFDSDSFDLLINSDSNVVNEDSEKVFFIDIDNPDPSGFYRKSKVTLVVGKKNSEEDSSVSVCFYKEEISLVLGSLRDPNSEKNKKHIVQKSIHEAGHALLYKYFTGKSPARIVSCGLNGGGYMMQQDENSVFNYSELIRELTVLVAGFAAESLVLDGVDFNKSNYTSTGKLSDVHDCDSMVTSFGSENDLQRAYKLASDILYKSGTLVRMYNVPVIFTNTSVDGSTDGVSCGLDVNISDNGEFTRSLNEGVVYLIKEALRQASEVLTENYMLLNVVSLELANVGIMSTGRFDELSNEHNFLCLCSSSTSSDENLKSKLEWNIDKIKKDKEEKDKEKEKEMTKDDYLVTKMKNINSRRNSSFLINPYPYNPYTGKNDDNDSPW